MDLSPRLSALVNDALQYPIAEIIAPAGFGKSTVIDSVARAQGFVVARVRPDADPVLALMSALCKAVAIHTPDLAAALPDAYANAHANDRLCDLAPWFVASLPISIARIAVDDLHLLRDNDVAWRLLENLIETTSSDRARWVLTSRIRPRLPEVEWVARGSQAKAITENDLAFDTDDILCASRTVGIALSSDMARQIKELTKGWPLLSLYALRLLAQDNDLALLSTMVTGSGIDAIAERLLSHLAPLDVRLLLAIALYDGASAQDLELTHAGAMQGLHRLVATGIPLIQERDGRWRLHELFRNQLLLRESKQCILEADEIARDLDAGGRVDDALRLAVAGGSPKTVQLVLERHVRHFIGAGDRHIVHQAASMLPTGALKSSWRIALIRGSDELRRGKPEIATSFFKSAVGMNTDSGRGYALSRLCHSLFWEGRSSEAIAALRECAAVALPDDAEEACEILGVLAWASIFTGEVESAEQAAAAAISLLPRVSDPLVEAGVYLRGGLVALNGVRLYEADEFARRAIELGERHRFFDILSRAFGLRKLVAAPSHESESLLFAKQSAYYAAKMLDRVAIYYAELAVFVLICRAGDLAEARRLLGRLVPVPETLKLICEALALESAAHLAMLDFDYDRADALLAGITHFGDAMMEPGLRAVRQLFSHSIGGLLDQFQGRCDNASRSARQGILLASDVRLDGLEIAAIPELEIAKIICAAILGLNGKMSEAETILADQAKNAHELYRRDLASWVSAVLLDPSAEPSEEAKTRANGIIILIQRALAAAQPVSLSAAERRVLESISEGRASKEIAAITGRSVHTVDNQVSAIMRKLNARSRGEAVARARRAGLLPTQGHEVVRA